MKSECESVLNILKILGKRKQTKEEKAGMGKGGKRK